MPALNLRREKSQPNINELQTQLTAELALCTDALPTYRNKVKKFMMSEGIYHAVDLDYPARERFEEFLAGEVSPASFSAYLKAFDRIKGSTVYENKILFLPYYPEPEIAGQFEKAIKKKNLVWDFSRDAPETMKRQIFATLEYELRNRTSSESLRVHLIALRKLYDFCTDESVEDIENLELEDIRRFTDTLTQKEKGQDIKVIDIHNVSVRNYRLLQESPFHAG